jgi:hypothetical protein
MNYYLVIAAAMVVAMNSFYAAIMPLSTTEETTSMSAGTKLAFANPAHFEQVRLIHDTVMGGRSEGAIEKASDPTGLRFHGSLSLANNGGFASVEFKLAESLSELPLSGIQLNAAGDGRNYQLRLKTPNIPRGAAYVAKFESSTDTTQYHFQLTSFVAQYRGRPLTHVPKLNFSDVSHISLMLADKDSGPFSIVLYSIALSK